MSSFKISVIITAYNLDAVISNAIESVLHQSYDNIECIVVDDCSTDGTLKIIERFKGIKVIHHDINQGAGKARQSGIDASTGDYIMFLDGDDWLERACIENLVEKAVETGADMCACNVRLINPDGTVLREETLSETVFEGISKWYCNSYGIQFLNSFIIRRKLFDKVKYCPRRLIEDTPTRYKLLWYADKVVYNGKIGYNYVQRDDSLGHSSSSLRIHFYRLLCALDLIDFFLEKCPGMILSLSLIQKMKQEMLLVETNMNLPIDKEEYIVKHFPTVKTLYNNTLKIIETMCNRKCSKKGKGTGKKK